MRSKDAYAEQCVFGKSLKIWYCDDTPVCMEIDTMPAVTGDGQASIRALLERRLSDLKRGKGRRADAADTPCKPACCNAPHSAGLRV